MNKHDRPHSTGADRSDRPAAAALARATVAALSEARWEVADVLSRHAPEVAQDLVCGRAAELSLSPFASDQMLATALQSAAQDLAEHRTPLEEGVLFFHGRAPTLAQEGEALERAAPSTDDPDADLRAVREFELRLRNRGLEGAELVSSLAEEAELQDCLWDDERLPVALGLRRRMRTVAGLLRERARALNAQLAAPARRPRREPRLEGKTGPFDLDALRHPPILLGDADHERLRSLAFSVLLSDPRAAAPLLSELERARVVPEAALPPGVVRLGSWVEYADVFEGRTARAKLVGSRQEQAAGDLSVLSPTGAALIGLSVGQTILWRDHIGMERLVTVREVRAP